MSLYLSAVLSPQDVYPYLGTIWKNTVPALITAFLMMVALTWLLLHAASQWARTRSEVKLLHRLPSAAHLAAAGPRVVPAAGGAGGRVPVSGMYTQPSPLPAV